MNRREVMIRRRQFSQRVIVFALSAVFVACFVLLGKNIAAAGNSNSTDKQENMKYYTSIQIESGDTLWSIANDYMSVEYDTIYDYIEEIKELNQLGVDDIQSGQFLTIPYYTSTSVASLR